uniref:Uncharacterized protein n=1 Tax=Romanomermis culicivorax TaxID=13658 RepID=A0A915JDS2_ROMCU
MCCFCPRHALQENADEDRQMVSQLSAENFVLMHSNDIPIGATEVVAQDLVLSNAVQEPLIVQENLFSDEATKKQISKMKVSKDKNLSSRFKAPKNFDPIMFNKSDSYEIFCGKERTSLLSFLLAIAFIIGTICGLITNCINLKIFMHKRYPTTTLSIYQMVLCFVDMVALLIGVLLSKILVLGKWSESIAFTNFWYKMMLVLYPMTSIPISTCVLIICALSIHYLITKTPIWMDDGYNH